MNFNTGMRKEGKIRLPKPVARYARTKSIRLLERLGMGAAAWAAQPYVEGAVAHRAPREGITTSRTLTALIATLLGPRAASRHPVRGASAIVAPSVGHILERPFNDAGVDVKLPPDSMASEKALSTLIGEQPVAGSKNLTRALWQVTEGRKELADAVVEGLKPTITKVVEDAKPAMQDAAVLGGQSIAKTLKPYLTNMVDDLVVSGIGSTAGYGAGELVSMLYRKPDITKLDVRHPASVRKFYAEQDKARKKRAATRLIMSAVGGTAAMAAYNKWGPGELTIDSVKAKLAQ